MTNEYPLLCSGFVSLTRERLIHDEFISDPFLDFVLDKDYLKSRNMNSYNKNITALFDKWVDNSDVISDFDFRKNLLEETAKAFSCYTITEWLEVQSNADTTGSLHAVFLEETFDFILRGKSRNTAVNTWYRLLTSDRRVTSVRFDVDSWIPTTNYGTYNGDVTIPGIVLEWVKRPNGFIDLLLSIYTIFGSRSDTVDVSNKQKV